MGGRFFVNLTGRRFGRWKVKNLVGFKPKGKTGTDYIIFRCVCDCGKQKNVASQYLVDGRSKSCGCLRKDFLEGPNNPRVLHFKKKVYVPRDKFD